ncbi:MAG: hypothetical protein JWL90_2877 [Chthoniobacteraceae bacterium]|nr:hypothetical protein [Chthoniobacteraceae bacterium]
MAIEKTGFVRAAGVEEASRVAIGLQLGGASLRFFQHESFRSLSLLHPLRSGAVARGG